MGPSTQACASSTDLSFLKRQGGLLKLLIPFLLAFSCLSIVIAAPTDSQAARLPHNKRSEVNPTEQGGLPNAILPRESEDISAWNPDRDLNEKRQAGLAWGPEKIGNLKLYLTNPHEGYAGPKFPWANHVNFHVDKEAPRNKYVQVVNLHMVKYTSTTGKSCFYAWDSVTKKTVFDNCFDDFGAAIVECVSAAKDFVDALLQAADFIAAVAIIAALVLALSTALTGLGAVALA